MQAASMECSFSIASSAIAIAEGADTSNIKTQTLTDFIRITY